MCSHCTVGQEFLNDVPFFFFLAKSVLMYYVPEMNAIHSQDYKATKCIKHLTAQM